jgi:hypothetical protein
MTLPIGPVARCRRDEEDAAVVITLLASLADRSATPEPASTFWGDPEFALGQVQPNRAGAWWSSGLPK